MSRSLWLLSIVALVATVAGPATVRAQDAQPVEAESDTRANMFRNVGKLIRSFQSLGNWDQHYGYMIDSVERVYQRQGWNSECDQFSLDLIRTVESVPPWAVQERFDTMVGLLSDRYMLDENQEQTLRRLMARTSNEVFQKHSDRILSYALEAVQARAAGEAFTPEQVQRWTELAEPVFQEMRGRLNENAKILAEELDPQQRELLQHDLAAANGRMARMEQLGQRWKRGEWSPDDWGLEHDPIQNAALARQAAEDLAEQQAAESGQPGVVSATPPEDQQAQPADVVPQPDNPATPQPQPNQRKTAQRGVAPTNAAADPWGAYIQAFINKYKLNAEQSERAWQIFADVRTRRDELQARAERRRSTLTDSAQPEALKAFETQNQSTLARLFDQMARRVDRLPTRQQRKEAGPEALPPNPVVTPSPARSGAPGPARKPQ